MFISMSHHGSSIYVTSPPPAVLQKAERTLVEAGFAAAAVGLTFKQESFVDVKKLKVLYFGFIVIRFLTSQTFLEVLLALFSQAETHLDTSAMLYCCASARLSKLRRTMQLYGDITSANFRLQYSVMDFQIFKL